MRDAVVCEPLRTPIGRFGGVLKTVPPAELAAGHRPRGEHVAKLRPVLGESDDRATVTAGNASGQNDAAAACVVTTPNAPPS